MGPEPPEPHPERYLGIDLAASPRRPSGYAVLDGRWGLRGLGRAGDDGEILALAQKVQPRLVAIDAPLSLPRGLCCLEESCPCRALAADGLKLAEGELLRRGIPLFPTTKRGIVKGLAYRGISLARALRAAGFAVVEVYPYANKVRLLGGRPPGKGTNMGRQQLRRALEPFIPGLAACPGPLDHDRLDALVAALTACLHAQGPCEALGDPEEGLIFVPLDRMLLREATGPW